MEEETVEIEESAEPLTDVLVDPHIAELEAEVAKLQGELLTANALIGLLRVAKDGYKAIAVQGANEFDYAWKISPTVYFERRKREFREELNAVKDVQ
jgi:hypothetical protein